MQGIDLDFEVLALWIILMMRWPLLSEYLSRHPKVVNNMSDKALSRFPDMPDKFKLLLQSEDVIQVLNGFSVGKKLDEKVIRQIAQL